MKLALFDSLKEGDVFVAHGTEWEKISSSNAVERVNGKINESNQCNMTHDVSDVIVIAGSSQSLPESVIKVMHEQQANIDYDAPIIIANAAVEEIDSELSLKEAALRDLFVTGAVLDYIANAELDDSDYVETEMSKKGISSVEKFFAELTVQQVIDLHHAQAKALIDNNTMRGFHVLGFMMIVSKAAETLSRGDIGDYHFQFAKLARNELSKLFKAIENKGKLRADQEAIISSMVPGNPVVMAKGTGKTRSFLSDWLAN